MTISSWEAKVISYIQVGDQVIASDVIFVPHGPKEESSLFVYNFTARGRNVMMTQNHIPPKDSCGSSLPLIYSSKVPPGD